ncbi:hypothetical protein [Kitasatospora sp. NPDC059327]|uniref:hypothetical protein n=1 Tax=Kitasatospora sp. NPDC059327 TaxID=3346803 RepID=UPI0036BF96ED
MTEVTHSTGKDPVEQHNHGSGVFVGHDNYGPIHHQAVDPETKRLLAELSRQAPPLARLLGTALRDGLISPETVATLAGVARHINEDVAYSLRTAGENINEDVAYSLRTAGENINRKVADTLADAARTLDGVDLAGLREAAARLDASARALDGVDLTGLQEVATRLDSTARLLTDTTTAFERLQDGSRLERIAGTLTLAADRIERTVTPPPPQLVVNRKATVQAFLWGLGAGAALAAYLLGRS